MRITLSPNDETQTHTHRGSMQTLIDLDFAEAQVVIGLAEALDSGALHPGAPTVTARAVAAVVYGPSPSRANVLDVGDLLSRLGVFVRGHGAAPHSRRMADLVQAVRAHEAQARATKQLPLTLR